MGYEQVAGVEADEEGLRPGRHCRGEFGQPRLACLCRFGRAAEARSGAGRGSRGLQAAEQFEGGRLGQADLGLPGEVRVQFLRGRVGAAHR